MSKAEYQVYGDVGVIVLHNPPVNALSHELRTGIVTALDQAFASQNIKAIVLTGAGDTFSGGADIREFDTPLALAPPILSEVISKIESAPKPVIAAIQGVAMGGGFELALGCHHRLAAPGAQIALPEVKLGLLPGAGGTQRLPRAIGASAALDMIVSGNSVAAEKLADLGAIDAIATGDLLQEAIRYAQQVVAQKRPLRKLRDEKVRIDGDAGAFFVSTKNEVAKRWRGFPAPLRCVACVEAAVNRSFDAGIKFERAAFDELIASIESKAMRHAFFAEREANRIPDIPKSTPTADIQRVAIIGAGTMGGGIAMAFANAKIPVTLVEMQQQALDRGLDAIRGNYAASVARGRLSQVAMDARMALLASTLDYEKVGDVDLVIEAVFEDMDVKKQVFQKLDSVMKPGAILATNTSTLDVNEIAAATKRPESVVGLHFFSPANVMRLLEIVRAAQTSKETLATVMKASKAIGKVGVVARVCDGFIGNRMMEEYLRQAYFLVEEGALPQQVDTALQNWGMAMGPYAVTDMSGQDIGWAIRKRRRAQDPERQIYPEFLDRICEMGRYGQKTGAGVYRYETGNRKPIPDPAIDKLILDHSKAQGIARREIGDQEIIERCIYALVNEGARILEEGIALRASDIDVVYLAGYGFPLYRGGPMFYADTVGLNNVVAAMERYRRQRHGEYWEPAPLLARLAAAGEAFNKTG